MKESEINSSKSASNTIASDREGKSSAKQERAPSQVAKMVEQAKKKVDRERRVNPYLRGKNNILHDQYEIKDVIGCGGFGITYKAWDRSFKRECAVKENLPATLARRSNKGKKRVVPLENEENQFEKSLESFEKEGQTLCQLYETSHKKESAYPRAMVRVQNLFRPPGLGTIFMAMEFVDGETLAETAERRWANAERSLKDEGKLEAMRPKDERLRLNKTVFPENELMTFITAIGEALTFMHNQGCFHRDLKPTNIMVRKSSGQNADELTIENPVLIDFGAARYYTGHETQNITSIMSYGFSPPEIASQGGNVGGWSDIYSLSNTLYYLIIGEAAPDFTDRTQEDLIVKLVECPTLIKTENGGYRREILAAIDHGLQIKIKDRPESVAEWLSEFEPPEEESQVDTVGLTVFSEDDDSSPEVKSELDEEESLASSELETVVIEDDTPEPTAAPRLPSDTPAAVVAVPEAVFKPRDEFVDPTESTDTETFQKSDDTNVPPPPTSKGLKTALLILCLLAVGAFGFFGKGILDGFSNGSDNPALPDPIVKVISASYSKAERGARVKSSDPTSEFRAWTEFIETWSISDNLPSEAVAYLSRGKANLIKSRDALEIKIGSDFRQLKSTLSSDSSASQAAETWETFNTRYKGIADHELFSAEVHELLADAAQELVKAKRAMDVATANAITEERVKQQNLKFASSFETALASARDASSEEERRSIWSRFVEAAPDSSILTPDNQKLLVAAKKASELLSVNLDDISRFLETSEKKAGYTITNNYLIGHNDPIVYEFDSLYGTTEVADMDAGRKSGEWYVNYEFNIKAIEAHQKYRNHAAKGAREKVHLSWKNNQLVTPDGLGSWTKTSQENPSIYEKWKAEAIDVIETWRTTNAERLWNQARSSIYAPYANVKGITDGTNGKSPTFNNQAIKDDFTEWRGYDGTKRIYEYWSIEPNSIAELKLLDEKEGVFEIDFLAESKLEDARTPVKSRVTLTLQDIQGSLKIKSEVTNVLK